MTTITTTTRQPIQVGKILLAPLAAIWRFLIAVGEANARVGQIERFSAMTDAELAARGIKRTEIVRHVFRDRLWS